MKQNVGALEICWWSKSQLRTTLGAQNNAEKTTIVEIDKIVFFSLHDGGTSDVISSQVVIYTASNINSKLNLQFNLNTKLHMYLYLHLYLYVHLNLNTNLNLNLNLNIT